MKSRKRPSIESLQSQIGLDSQGRPIWLVPRIQGKDAGAIAGERSRTIRVDKVDVPVAHVVFAIKFGAWPAQSLDGTTGAEFNKKAVRLEMTQERLRQVLHYEPGTGVFTWVARASGKVVVGRPAGGVHPFTNYARISVDGKRWLSHRLAWIYMTGESPPPVIDHIDGNPCNNRWANLRASSPALNSENKRKATSSNKCGILGVRRDVQSGKFIAEITVNGAAMRLGRFTTPEAAGAAYLEAKRQFHAGCTL